MLQWVKSTLGLQKKQQVVTPGAAEAIKNKGNTFLDAEQYVDAEACYRQALALDPNYAVAHHNLGLALKFQRRMDESKAAFSRAVELDSSLARSWYHLATFAVSEGNTEKAKELFQRALALDPEFSTCYQDLALLQHSTGDTDGAELTLRQALLFNPDEGPLYIDLGNLYCNKARDLEAIDAYTTGFDKMEPADEPWYWDARRTLGISMCGVGRHTEAEAIFREILEKFPNSAHVLINLSVVFIERRDFDQAEELLRRALSLDEFNTDGLNNYGFALQKLGRIDEAITIYQKTIELRPEWAPAYCNLGTVLQDQLKLDEALALYNKAIELDPDYASARFDRSLLQLMHGNFAAGWREYETRWELPAQKKFKREFSQPLWLGEPGIAGKTLLIYAEQGFGDTIQFVRFVEPLTKLGANVILEVPKPLASLFGGLPFYRNLQLVRHGDPLPGFDLQCPMMSLPLAFGMTSTDQIAFADGYLRPDDTRVAHWAGGLASHPKKIGVVWSGNPNNANDRNRSLTLAEFAPVLDDAAAHFVILQEDIRPADRPHLPARANIQQVGEHLTSFAETAALIANLDLVITVDSAIAHLAGALGKPVWVMIPFVPDFRWLLEREDSPWYTSAKLYRQSERANWATVVDRIRTDLEKFTPADA